MLSNLLDVIGYGGFTYGAFVLGGRGPAAFVGGFCFLLLSYSLSSSGFSIGRRVTTALHREVSEVLSKPPRDPRVITNETLAEALTKGLQDTQDR